MIFTENSTYGDIIKNPRFEGWAHMLGMSGGAISEEFAKTTLLEYEKSYSEWNAKFIKDSANYMYQKREHEQVFYPIWSEEEINKDSSKRETGLAAFPLEKKSKFALICPGGGYGAVCSLMEGYPLAKRFNDMGYAAFVVRYRVGENARFPNPLDDLAAALSYILEHAETFHLDVEDYCLVGFSAGAHLSGCFCLKDVGYGNYNLPKPGTVVLGYPWLSLNDTTKATVNGRKRILGEDLCEDAVLIRKYSVAENVTEEYPPAYIWQCDGDPAVSVDNSANMVIALKKNGVPYAYEMFHYPTHGLREAAEDYPKMWWKRAIHFWEERYKKNDRI